eukprot:2368742-Prymnesium_polylepis.1
MRTTTDVLKTSPGFCSSSSRPSAAWDTRPSRVIAGPSRRHQGPGATVVATSPSPGRLVWVVWVVGVVQVEFEQRHRYRVLSPRCLLGIVIVGVNLFT